MLTEEIKHVVDRASWPKGPWDKEPEDRIQWQHAGYACLMVRQSASGVWCGYVGVPLDHPALRDLESLDVHGGVTYCNICSPPICHVPEPGMPAEVKWIGFDCQHCDDFAPGTCYSGWMSGVYRTRDWVKAEVERLATQLASIGVQSQTCNGEDSLNRSLALG